MYMYMSENMFEIPEYIRINKGIIRHMYSSCILTVKKYSNTKLYKTRKITVKLCSKFSREKIMFLPKSSAHSRLVVVVVTQK